MVAAFYSKTTEECPGLHHQIAEAIIISIWKGRRGAKRLVSHAPTWAGCQLNTGVSPSTLLLKEQLSLSHEGCLSHHGPWQISALGQAPQFKTILKRVLRTKHFNSKEGAILQVPVPGMLKVPIHSSQAAISTGWRHQSQRDAARPFLRGCGITPGMI